MARERGRWNLPLRTWGGKQFWTDHTIYGGWRIQRRVYGGHFRLLDARDVRRAWGALAACEDALAAAKASGATALSSDRLCLLLHGLGRSKDSMARLRKAVVAAGFEAYSLNYASTRLPVQESAAAVAALLCRIAPDFRDIGIVTHSLGGSVVRAARAHAVTPNVTRVVMIAPPNQGAVLANRMARRWASRQVLGPALEAIRPDAPFLAGLPPPPCPFGIISGVRGRGRGWNPLVPGDDGVLDVDSTWLAGATETAEVRRTHTLIMNAPEVAEMTVRFLRDGRFGEGSENPGGMAG